MLAEELAAGKVAASVTGGATRAESVRAGLAEVPDEADVILVHDAARPLVTDELVERLIGALWRATTARSRACRSPTPSSASATARSSRRSPRDELVAVQTPQAFVAPVLRAAAARRGNRLRVAGRGPRRARPRRRGRPAAAQDHDAGRPALERVARRSCWLDDEPEPRRDDPRRARRRRARARARASRSCSAAFASTTRRGLAGHSDGDVIAHALIDAVLGAAGPGDIGSLFPSGDERSQALARSTCSREAYEQVAEAASSSSTPTASWSARSRGSRPHREEMAARLAAALGVDPDRVDVRATTTDRLGFTGRDEGLAAQAVALLER